MEARETRRRQQNPEGPGIFIQKYSSFKIVSSVLPTFKAGIFLYQNFTSLYRSDHIEPWRQLRPISKNATPPSSNFKLSLQM
jgi:hypothetical protein